MKSNRKKQPLTRILPESYDEWQEAAKRLLKPWHYSYIYSSAGEESTSRANREAFYRWRIAPRVLRDVANRDISIELFGRRIRAPILIAPMGGNANIHALGEIALGRAGSSVDIPLILSTVSSNSIEEVGSAIVDGIKWFQLYPCSDKEVMASFLSRAKSAGYSAIVVTVDRPAEYPRYGSSRYREKRARNMKNFVTDPVFHRKAKEMGTKSETELYDKIRMSSSLSWDDIGFLKKESQGLPLLLKGVLHPKDAELALDHGIDGIIVSNHGGRRMDGEVAALDVLPGICDVVSSKIPVLLDSGIRGGVDVVKALALGARAVLVGRLCAYGLAVGGEAGVKKVLQNLMKELDSALAICGCKSIAELDRSILIRA